jgi:hypothetical protein
MTPRRPLGEMLEDVALGALRAAAAPGVAVTRLSVTLPVEVSLALAGGEWRLLGDLPRMVTRTAFDSEPSRLEVVWTAGEPA